MISHYPMSKNTLEHLEEKASDDPEHNCSHLVFKVKCKLQPKVCITLLGEDDDRSYFACSYNNPKKCNNYSPRVS